MIGSAAQAGNNQPNETVAQYFSANPGVSALTVIGGSPGQETIYFNPSAVMSMGSGSLVGMLLHELAHAVSGLTDDQLQDALGLTVGKDSRNISFKLMTDCFMN